jgi:hypothetical protein
MEAALLASLTDDDPHLAALGTPRLLTSSSIMHQSAIIRGFICDFPASAHEAVSNQGLHTRCQGALQAC